MNFPKDELTFGLGLVGTVLGIMNMWRVMERDRVKLRVTPKTAYPVGSPDTRVRLCIEVTNLSAFAVTVSEAGLTLRRSPIRLGLAVPILIDGGPWPRRLEPRASVTVYFAPELITDPRCSSAGKAYATTACGETRYGTSKALFGYSHRAEVVQ